MKKLVEYGVAAHHFNTAQEAHSHTYMTRDGRAVPTPLIFPDNPYNEAVKNAKVILEIGSGTGRNLPWIMNNTTAHYIGVEPNPSMHQFFWDIQPKEYQNRVSLHKSFDELNPELKVDIVVVTFVFQHVGYRPPEGQMNITDITEAARAFCTRDTVWIMYEHDWEEQWIGRWTEENDILPQVYKRDYAGIPEIAERGAHHLIIWKDR
jgi:SAM-dependent methyltransferase